MDIIFFKLKNVYLILCESSLIIQDTCWEGAKMAWHLVTWVSRVMIVSEYLRARICAIFNPFNTKNKFLNFHVSCTLFVINKTDSHSFFIKAFRLSSNSRVSIFDLMWNLGNKTHNRNSCKNCRTFCGNMIGMVSTIKISCRRDLQSYSTTKI